MQTIMEQWDAGPGLHTDNTTTLLLVVITKALMDTMLFFVFNKMWSRSFLGLCGLSIIAMDWAMAFCMASVWFFGAEKVSLSFCFILAHASATYGALPVPMTCLGILDYCFDDAGIGRRRPKCKLFRNVVLMLVVWIQAGIFSAVSTNSQLTVYKSSIDEKIILCALEENQGIFYSVLLVLAVLLVAIWPFYPKVFQWIKEAHRLTKEREDEDKKRSDLFNLNSCTQEQICKTASVQKTSQPRPPLWFSLTLGFGLAWLPYLITAVVCLLFHVAIPAYIGLNIMWLECVHSVLAGVVFWAKSSITGPYSDLPENTCSWHVYWHLSRDTQTQPQPIGVFNPTTEREKPFLCL